MKRVFMFVLLMLAAGSNLYAQQFVNGQDTRILREIRDNTEKMQRDNQLIRLEMMQKDSQLRQLQEGVVANDQAALDLLRESKDRELAQRQSEIDDAYRLQLINSVQMRNTVTYCAIFLGYVALTLVVLLKLKADAFAQPNEKEGLVGIVVALLVPWLPLLTTVEDWSPLLDFFTNYASADIVFRNDSGYQIVYVLPIRYFLVLSVSLMVYCSLMFLNVAPRFSEVFNKFLTVGKKTPESKDVPHE